MEAAVDALERFDQVLAGLLDVWNHHRGTVIITSDHGNIEDLSIRTHTLNPVPSIVIGRHHRRVADRVTDLTDIAPAVLSLLSG
jgi:bisphosphoglycerate-independent phosphoglycerate mutase (AlkP superfamily)